MKKMKLETYAGNDIRTVAIEAQKIATGADALIVSFDFNGIECLVSSKTNLDYLYRDYLNAFDMGWKEIGPDCVAEYDQATSKALEMKKAEHKEEQRKSSEAMDKKDAEEKLLADSLTAGIAISIIPGKEQEYAEYVAKNSNDGYSRGVVDYAEYWAKKMQVLLVDGSKTVAEVAPEAEKGLGFLGITGFMYGCAMQALTHFWIHGEELKEWHNQRYGVAKGASGVINPAVLTLKTAEV